MAEIKIKGRGQQRIPFKLETPDGIEEFTVRGLPAWMFLEVMGKVTVDSEDVQDLAQQAAMLVDIFKEIIGDEDEYLRFSKTMRNPNNGFIMDDIVQLLQQLAEEAAKRPTEPSKSSGRGRAKTNAGSTDTASEKALTLAK